MGIGMPREREIAHSGSEDQFTKQSQWPDSSRVSLLGASFVGPSTQRQFCNPRAWLASKKRELSTVRYREMVLTSSGAEGVIRGRDTIGSREMGLTFITTWIALSPSIHASAA